MFSLNEIGSVGSSDGASRAQPKPTSKARYVPGWRRPNDPRSESASQRFADSPCSTPS